MTTLSPSNQSELAAMLRDANARGQAVIPRGGGTKSDWGNPPARADVILSTAALNQVEEHAWADLTATVQAGVTLAQLQKILSERGQRLAVDPLWPEQASIGGVLSTNDTGALRLSFGGLRDLIIGVTIALADGTLAESGGKVVKNVAGYDLPKLVTGALGTLGVITRAVFRLHPLPHHSRTLTAKFTDAGKAQEFMLKMQASKLAHTALQLRAPEMECDVLIEGTQAGIDAQTATVRGFAPADENSSDVWRARQDLFAREGAIVKLSLLPADINGAVEALEGSPAVIQATGLGFAVTNAPAALRTKTGACVVLRQHGAPIDAWGPAGDALPLMRAVKQQFDPNGTLNPGRYVGGI
jgi:glycolate oxidase FAD binding subunit